jgi:hypothetical protein
MKRKNLKYFPITALLSFSPLIVIACGLPSPAAAQAQITMPVEVLPGPPDLAALCSASKDNVEGNKQDSATITITLQNLLTPPQYPYVYTGKVQLLGSEASTAMLRFKVPKPLSVGTPPPHCANDVSDPELWGFGIINAVSIPAGGSIKINFPVTAEGDCCSKVKIEAMADHLNHYPNEPSETNNNAIYEILVWRIDDFVLLTI